MMPVICKFVLICSFLVSRVSCEAKFDAKLDVGEAFDEPHEEGDEHIVNREICSKDDLPEEVVDAYDRCTNFIPVYKQLNLLTRCRSKVFPGNLSKNSIRKIICFNRTAEHEFNQCLSQIKTSAEGKSIPPANPLQTMDFMFCMKTIALRRVRKTSSNFGCQTIAIAGDNGKTQTAATAS
jgi:hypothetical protein